jgi:hypothetical protein
VCDKVGLNLNGLHIFLSYLVSIIVVILTFINVFPFGFTYSLQEQALIWPILVD